MINIKMNKLAVCVFALSMVAVCIEGASLAKSNIPYERSMERFRDVLRGYQAKFPESTLIKGILDDLTDIDEMNEVFFPSIIMYFMLPGYYHTITIITQMGQQLYPLGLDVLTDFNWIKLSDIPVLTQTTEFEALYPLSAPLLDFIESIDLSLLWTFNPESLSDAQKVSLGATLKNGINKLIDDLFEVQTIAEMAKFDFMKYINSLTAALGTQGIITGK